LVIRLRYGADCLDEEKEAHMPIGAIGGFLAYSLVNAFTPGPGNILAMSTAAQYGLQRGKPLFIGIFCGYFCVQAICGVTVFAIGAMLPAAMDVLKAVGIVYIVWLAVHIARSTPEFGDTANGRASFWTGFLLQFANVKIYLFGITAVTGFVTAYSTALGAILIAEAFIASLGTVATATWIGAGVALQRFYVQHHRGLNGAFALSLGLCAVEMMA
jgi:cysteine/O-acetylserine efflux protein